MLLFLNYRLSFFYFTKFFMFSIITNMKRILLKIEYDGSRYSGWQKQPERKTIQGEIEDAIFRSIGEKVEVFASGRTDAGVHAFGQTAHFDLNLPVPVSKIPQIINNNLPKDISIIQVKEVEDNFHARFSIKKKTYLYKIYNSSEKNAFIAYRAGWIKEKLNISKMKEISNLLIGQHDFRGFCSSNTATQDFVRTIFDIKIYKKDNYVFIEVCGSGFLYNMVRIIVGTLVDYSLDKINKENVLLALNNGNRNFSGRTMPAEGLYLKETFY